MTVTVVIVLYMEKYRKVDSVCQLPMIRCVVCVCVSGSVVVRNSLR